MYAIAGPIRAVTPKPERIVTVGVTRISTLVSLETALPSSAAIITANKVPKGPPTAFAPIPTAQRDKRTREGASSAAPIATCVFKLENSIAVASGMGTCGLVGPIGVIAGEGFGSVKDWIGLVLVCVVLPAILTYIIAIPFRKLGWIKENDLKLDL